MRILANKNFPGPVVRALRERGVDVAWLKEDMPRVADEVVLSQAQQQGRILVTCDKDFGELACRFGLPASCGIVLFRLAGACPERDNARALLALTSRDDWTGTFAVVHDDRIRLRPSPPKP